jgi:TonB family protein
MSQTEVRKTEVWKTWEGRAVDGKFPLRKWLGVSEHSGVFLTERRPSQRAAIKLIPADAADSEAQLARWKKAAQLSHPHLLQVFESGRCQMDGSPHLYLVMECADEDLSQILPQRALTPGEAADLLPPLLDALSYLHGKGLVHGRLKPSNLHAVGDQLKLSVDSVSPVSGSSSAALRRDAYDAPESAAGIISPAGDLWSLGVTLTACLTQNVPLAGELSLRDPVAPEKMPEPFRGIVRECLHLDPRRRCTLADVQARLQPAARSVPAGPDQVAAAERPPRRWGITALIVALAVVVGLIIIYSRGKTTTPSATNQPAQQASPSSASVPPASQPSATQTPQPSAGSPARQPASKPTPATPTGKPKQQKTAPPAPSTTGRGATGATGQAASASGIVRQVIPDVPRSARNTIRGRIRVDVRATVDASGKVTGTNLTVPGPSKYFAGLAVKAARSWEFAPAAAGTWTIHFHFARSGTQATPERLNR